MTDNTRELVGINEAERIVGKQLWYWLNNGRGPKFEIIAGRKVFEKADLLAWHPLKRSPGRKNNGNG